MHSWHTSAVQGITLHQYTQWNPSWLTNKCALSTCGMCHSQETVCCHANRSDFKRFLLSFGLHCHNHALLILVFLFSSISTFWLRISAENLVFTGSYWSTWKSRTARTTWSKGKWDEHGNPFKSWASVNCHMCMCMYRLIEPRIEIKPTCVI